MEYNGADTNIQQESNRRDPMRSVHLLIKPASGMCNMRCQYCFYADETSKRETPNYGIMSRQTISAVLEHALEAADAECTIAFQGGEPTLAGLDFFRFAVAEAKEKNRNYARLHFAIQTNGLAIDDDWAAFFAENHFLVGVSLDGTKEVHDCNRIDAARKGTFGRVVHAIEIMERHGVDYNILTVITKNTVRSYRAIHSFFKKKGFRYQQFIPCLDPLEEERGGKNWSLTPELFEKYLKQSFDLWYEEAMAGDKQYHRYFDNLLCMLDGQPPEACGMAGRCGLQYVVEADGSTYPCDFYMLDAYRIGNLAEDTIEAVDARRKEIGFIEQSLPVPEDCGACRWYALCRGGCRRDRDYFEKGIGRNYYCAAYRAFFEYAYPRLVQLYRFMTMP